MGYYNHSKKLEFDWFSYMGAKIISIVGYIHVLISIENLVLMHVFVVDF